MSRSYRHTPIVGNTTARTDKPGKMIANRTLRAHTRAALHFCRDYENLLMPLLRELSNVWSFPKDGKHRMRKANWRYSKYMRK